MTSDVFALGQAIQVPDNVVVPVPILVVDFVTSRNLSVVVTPNGPMKEVSPITLSFLVPSVR
jgi:hypothetical protein